MPAPTPVDDAHLKLLESLDIARAPRPFRNPAWKPSARRNKNVKQIISESSRREASAMASQAQSGSSTPFAASAAGGEAQTPAPGGGGAAGGSVKGSNIAQAAQSLSTLVLEKNFRSLLPASSSGPAVTYTNIESAPSLSPAQRRRYCDITGLPALYTDPKTRLRYHDKEVFAVVRSLPQGVPESYLEVRGAHTVLK